MSSEKIKNIGILAHVDAGKTSITEQLLFKSGAIRSAGSVDAGTTQSDSMSVERERGISVRSSQISFCIGDTVVNLIDTPGHTDFAGEVERSLAALDGAVLVISSVEGVQAHTESLWRALRKLKIPALVFINKIDRAGSRYEDIVTHEMPKLLGFSGFIPVTYPVNEGGDNASVSPCDALTLTEKAADFDDGIAEKYLNGDSLSDAELNAALARCTADCTVVPVLCGSAKLSAGTDTLLSAINTYLPSAARREVDSLSAVVFKIEHDSVMGKLAHVRMFGGSLSSRESIGEEKISQVRKFNGEKYTDIGTVSAGDIAALCGLKNAKVGDIIGEYHGESFSLACPFLRVKAAPAQGAELTPLLNALRELADEEPLLDCKWEKTEREILINITGQIQLDVIRVLLKERYGLEAEFSDPAVIYKETPAKAAYGFDAYTMPKPCWAVVKFLLEPLPRGSGVEYSEERIPPNRLAYKYREHIRSSFYSSLEQGRLGWEVTDFRATLVDGEHHHIHTHPLDFFVATPMALQNGLAAAGSQLLEPYLHYRITAPSELLGKLVSEFLSMRGEFSQPEVGESSVTIEASVPVGTSLDFPVRLASISGGRATLFSRFDGYRDCPLELGRTAPRRGIDPIDRSKWILQARGAIR